MIQTAFDILSNGKSNHALDPAQLGSPPLHYLSLPAVLHKFNMVTF